MRTRLWIALVVISCASCYDPDATVAPDDILLLTAAPAAIPANGFSTARITAKITTDSNRGVTVSFTTSGGTLSSTAAMGTDSNGEASVFLTSEATPKTVSVTAEVKDGAAILASRSVAVTFDPASASSVLRLTVSASQIEADGASSVLLTAEANPAASGRTVSFTTTDGSFVRGSGTPVLTQNNIATGADGIARAQLFAPLLPGTALITATSNGFSASQTIGFVSALPDFITLKAEPLAISRDEEENTVDLTAVLSRSIGSVSRNTRVDFTAVNDATSQAFGRFQNVTRSNAAETVTAQFVPGTTAPLGLATITARVPGTNVSAQVKVNIIEDP